MSGVLELIQKMRRRARAEELGELLKREFRNFDADADGVLNFSEFQYAMRNFINTTDEESRLLFNTFDKDGSGQLSLEEFVREAASYRPPPTRPNADNHETERASPRKSAVSSDSSRLPPAFEGGQLQRKSSSSTVDEFTRQVEDVKLFNIRQEALRLGLRAINALPRYDRLSSHTRPLRHELAKSILINAFEQKEASCAPATGPFPSGSSSLGRSSLPKQKVGLVGVISESSFRRVLRRFTPAGQQEMTSDEANRLYARVGGNYYMLADILFGSGFGFTGAKKKEGEANKLEAEIRVMAGQGAARFSGGDAGAAIKAKPFELAPATFGGVSMQEQRPALGDGPLDRRNSGERMIMAPSLAVIPRRIQYRHCRTFVSPPSAWDTRLLTRSGKRPIETLELEYVYGFGGCIDQRAKNLAFSLVTGEWIYPAAAVVVLLDVQRNCQRHLIHEQDVMCVALDAGGRYAATGSLSSRPVLRIWDIGTSSTSKPVKITEIGLLPAPPSTEGVDIYGRGNERQETTIPFYERCIACVAFSSDPGANYVVGVGHDLRHMVAIWHWRSGKLIAESPGKSGLPGQVFDVLWAPEWKNSTALSLALSLRPTGSSTNKDSTLSCDFVTFGIGHVKFWSFRPALSRPEERLTWRGGTVPSVSGASCHPAAFYSAAFLPCDTNRLLCFVDGGVAAAGSDGRVYIFDPLLGVARSSVQAHSHGPVLSVVLTPDRSGLWSGGADGYVHMWKIGIDGFSAEKQESFQICNRVGETPSAIEIVNSPGDNPKLPVKSQKSSSSDSVSGRAEREEAWRQRNGENLRALCVRGGVGGEIGIGTDNSRLLVLSRTGELREVMAGHFGPLRGLAAPRGGEERLASGTMGFVTAGEDGQVIIWDATQKVPVTRASLGRGFRACAVDLHPDGVEVAVGLMDGLLLVLRASDLSEVCRCVAGKEAVSEIRYSPNGRLLAVATHDNFVELFDTTSVPTNKKSHFGLAGVGNIRADRAGSQNQGTVGSVSKRYRRVGRCKGHSSAVLHIDWSTDGRILQSTCAAGEILYWDALSASAFRSSSENATADIPWHTWSLTRGFPVMGIWPSNTDDTDINAVWRSRDESLLATVDDFSGVKLFNYPCVVNQAPFSRYAGHSSHVANVRFTARDCWLISVGSNDRCAFQWRLVRHGGPTDGVVSMPAHRAVKEAWGGPSDGLEVAFARNSSRERISSGYKNVAATSLRPDGTGAVAPLSVARASRMKHQASNIFNVD